MLFLSLAVDLPSQPFIISRHSFSSSKWVQYWLGEFFWPKRLVLQCQPSDQGVTVNLFSLPRRLKAFLCPLMPSLQVGPTLLKWCKPAKPNNLAPLPSRTKQTRLLATYPKQGVWSGAGMSHRSAQDARSSNLCDLSGWLGAACEGVAWWLQDPQLSEKVAGPGPCWLRKTTIFIKPLCLPQRLLVLSVHRLMHLLIWVNWTNPPCQLISHTETKIGISHEPRSVLDYTSALGFLEPFPDLTPPKKAHRFQFELLRITQACCAPRPIRTSACPKAFGNQQPPCTWGKKPRVNQIFCAESRKSGEKPQKTSSTVTVKLSSLGAQTSCTASWKLGIVVTLDRRVGNQTDQVCLTGIAATVHNAIYTYMFPEKTSGCTERGVISAVFSVPLSGHQRLVVASPSCWRGGTWWGSMRKTN